MTTFNSRDEAVGYLAGMIDGEGTVTAPHQASGRHNNRTVEIGNTNPELIDATMEALALLNIEARVVCYETTAKWKPIYRILITGRPNLEAVLREIPMRSTFKHDRLIALIDSYKVVRPDPPRELLWDLYVERGWSGPQIAAHLNYALPTLYAVMRRADIPRRTRSQAHSLAWRTGRVDRRRYAAGSERQPSTAA